LITTGKLNIGNLALPDHPPTSRAKYVGGVQRFGKLEGATRMKILLQTRIIWNAIQFKCADGANSIDGQPLLRIGKILIG
jgi:hypothetical protein